MCPHIQDLDDILFSKIEAFLLRSQTFYTTEDLGKIHKLRIMKTDVIINNFV